MIYDMYQKLCPYKHYAPAVMPTWFNVTDEWVMKPQNSAVISAMHCLYIALLYTANFQDNLVYIQTLVAKYNQILSS